MIGSNYIFGERFAFGRDGDRENSRVLSSTKDANHFHSAIVPSSPGLAHTRMILNAKEEIKIGALASLFPSFGPCYQSVSKVQPKRTVPMGGKVMDTGYE